MVESIQVGEGDAIEETSTWGIGLARREAAVKIKEEELQNREEMANNREERLKLMENRAIHNREENQKLADKLKDERALIADQVRGILREQELVSMDHELNRKQDYLDSLIRLYEERVNVDEMEHRQLLSDIRRYGLNIVGGIPQMPTLGPLNKRHSDEMPTYAELTQSITETLANFGAPRE